MNKIANRVCIIGAGSSGIAVCKVLKESGIPFDCYEASDRIGGNWVYLNSNKMSSIYKSLHINSSKKLMQYSDFPMPEHYPNFPHHSQVAEYFENYATHFDIKPHIRFKTKVISAEPLSEKGWKIVLDNNITHNYRALIVANGHHWKPRWPKPSFPGHFDGLITHGHYYKTPDEYVDKNVLVVGFGNSAMDISCELSHIAKNVFLSVRRGFFVTPKHILGKPLDQAPIPRIFPLSLKLKIQELAVKLQIGNLEQFGLPKPEHKYMHAHPTISSNIIPCLTHGLVKPKPNIQKLEGDRILFVDGTSEQVERIIYCTGYDINFPFFSPELIKIEDNKFSLFKHIFHPQYRNLFFIGLIQPIGPVMPLAELQSKLISHYLKGEYILPSVTRIQKELTKSIVKMQKRYGEAARHTIQVDFEPYIRELKQELQAGKLRRKKRKIHQTNKASLLENTFEISPFTG